MQHNNFPCPALLGLKSKAMKKLILLLVCVASFVATQAQAKFGIKSGLNFANLTNDIEGDMKLSFYAGAFANVPVASRFSVQPELVFSRQGTRFDDPGDDIKWRLNYLNVPILGQYNDPSGFYAEMGPQFGFLLHAKVKDDGDVRSANSSFKSFDLSWGFGAGFNFTQQAGIGLRWNLGLTDVWDHPGTANNSVLQVGATYRLN